MCKRTQVRPNHGWAWLLIGLMGCSGCGGKPAAPGSEKFAEGRKDLSGGKPQEAIAAFTEAINQNHEDAKAVFYRAVAYAKEGATDKAIAGYEEAIRLHNKIASELRYRGKSGVVPLEGELVQAIDKRVGAIPKRAGPSGKQVDYDGLIGELTEVITFNSDSAAAYYGRGCAFLANGSPDLALGDLTDAIRLDPDYQEAFRERARAYTAVGNHAQETIDDCLRAIRLNPKCDVAYETLGAAYASSLAPDFAKAIAAYKEALKLNHNLASEIEPQMAAAYWNWALTLDRAGQVDEAKDKLYRAIALDPNAKYDARWVQEEQKTLLSAGVPRTFGPQEQVRGYSGVVKLIDQASAFLKQGQFDDAIKTFSLALQIDPKNYAARYGHGLAFLEKGFPDTAIEDFDLAIGLNRNAAEAFCQRSRAHTALGDDLHGVQDGTEAIRLQPDFALAYYYRGVAYLDAGTFERALADFSEAEMLGPNLRTKTHPKIAEAHRGQGLRNLRIQRWNDAIADFSEAIRLERRWAKRLGPQLADAYRGRGLDRTKDEEFKLAIVDLSEAVRLDPTNAKNYRARGLTYNRIGNWDFAAADLSRALELDPGLDYELRRPLTEAQRNLGRVYAPVR